MSDKSVKDIYNEIGSWLKKQNPTVIEFLKKQQASWDNTCDLGKLQTTLQYYDNIKEESKINREYIFGQKFATLKDISKHMLDSMGNYGPKKGESREDFDEDAQHCGYADVEMFKEIKNFWKDFDEDALLSIASGSEMDNYEIDLDGHRCYFLSHSHVYPLIFNYVFYKLKKTPQELDEDLYNDNETFDRIKYFYPPEEIFLPSDDVIAQLSKKFTGKNTKKAIDDFAYDIDKILKCEKYQKEPLLNNFMTILSQLNLKSLK